MRNHEGDPQPLAVLFDTPRALLGLIKDKADQGQKIPPDLTPAILAQIRVLAEAAERILHEGITILPQRDTQEQVKLILPISEVPESSQTKETPQEPFPEFISIKKIAEKMGIKGTNLRRLNYLVHKAYKSGKIERRGESSATTYRNDQIVELADQLLVEINHPGVKKNSQ